MCFQLTNIFIKVWHSPCEERYQASNENIYRQTEHFYSFICYTGCLYTFANIQQVFPSHHMFQNCLSRVPVLSWIIDHAVISLSKVFVLKCTDKIHNQVHHSIRQIIAYFYYSYESYKIVPLQNSFHATFTCHQITWPQLKNFLLL